MERLTKRMLKGNGYYMKCSETCPHDCQETCDCEEFDKFVDLLAAYEKTGLEPKKIEHIVDAYGRGLSLRTESAQRLELVREIPVDRLREIAEAEREGRCVVLPCKLHDKVFFVENGCMKEAEVDSFHNWTSGHWKMSTHTDRMFDHWKGYEIDFSGVGKTVFLTREAAEAVLKGCDHG